LQRLLSSGSRHNSSVVVRCREVSSLQDRTATEDSNSSARRNLRWLSWQPAPQPVESGTSSAARTLLDSNVMKRICAIMCAVLCHGIVQETEACSGSLACLSGEGFPAASSVPANVPGFLVLGFDGPLPLDTARLIRVGQSETDVPTTLEADGLLVPDEPLQTGVTYRVEAQPTCDPRAELVTWTFEAGREQAPADSLGVLSVNPSPLDQIPTPASAECWDWAPAAGAEVILSLSTDAAPWEDCWIYETLVDGEVWLPSATASPDNGYGVPPQEFAHFRNGGSWVGRGRDFVFVGCGDFPLHGMKEGEHTVQMQARLPGSGNVLTTEAVTFELRCDASTEDAGVPVGPDSEAELAADVRDADGGCATGGRPDGEGWILLLALLSGVFRFRRPRPNSPGHRKNDAPTEA